MCVCVCQSARHERLVISRESATAEFISSDLGYSRFDAVITLAPVVQDIDHQAQGNKMILCGFTAYSELELEAPRRRPRAFIPSDRISTLRVSEMILISQT